METVANFIVKHKKIIIILYLILCIVAFIGNRFVEVNYDLSLYLPKDLNSIKGKNILEEEFGIGGIAYILIKDEPFNEIENIVKDVEAIEGAREVIWLGTVEDIFKPEDFMDEDVKKEFISGNSNLIQIHFVNSNDSLETVEAIEEIKNVLGEKGMVGGPAAVSHDLQYTTAKEVKYYSLLAFVIVSIILFLSLESFIEPILFFITIGAAIILNMGTNIIFDNISFTTHSVAAIIQLAVSMDYSIFLLHRYVEEKEKHKDKEQAMIESIHKTFISISSSSLTTIAGFLALMIMKYAIGKDLGMVLAKGVFFSLLSVVTLLPVLILLFDEAIEKYKHKVYMPSFKKSAVFIIKRKYIFLVVAILIAIPAYLAQSNVKYYYANEKILPESSDSNIAIKEIDKLFSNKNQLALILPKGNKLKEFQLIKELEAMEEVVDVKELYSMVDVVIPETFIPEDIKDNFQSEHYSLININLNLPMEGDITKDSLNKIKTKVSNYYEEWYLTGESAIYSDLQKTTAKDFKNVNILSIILISSIILIAFKSISIPLILVFIIQLGIWINLAIPYIQGTELNFISFIIIGAIQLGATVDYAILFTSRYKENLEIISNRNDASIQTIKDTGRSILTSALILFTGTFSVYLITSMSNTKELTLLIGRGAIISLILVLMVLPSLLIMFDKIIRFSTFNWPKTNDRRRR